MSNKAIYPGTFDPITNGHISIITRATLIFSKIILAITTNPSKNPMFSIEKRVECAKEAVAHLKNVEIIRFSGLLIHLAQEQKTNVLIRGLRNVEDFENETKRYHMNKYLNPTLEIIFLMATEESTYLSSSLIKEIAQNGGNVESLLPASAFKALTNVYQT
ncbi:pantetheine-phosphate adenylyltransferase [Candidatus Erwinia haradaeae]|uniref:Phosphopantetheine adenylyltransferase n=1 Tax=Candidatus Erwinia haradaeae TaxID=1922217 RepID=A0A451D7S3_9GAMM|nr:pantetheine-phosphate adenylyltransferase [Candidatus Erwinia haradaeae]VFP81823.1 Phosphopantetheine adenylyltransferase [Candidatus Erwinia haradaeae]